ncbi:MAG TPA: LysE family translocator [Opitutaceae bacterium]
MHGYWAQFVKLAVAHLLAAMSPGPDFAIVVRQSLAHGRRAALWTSVGIGTAILLHVTYTVLGIGLLVRSSAVAFTVIKFAGAAYLAWIGAKALATRPRDGRVDVPFGAGSKGAPPAEPGPRRAFSTGFLTNALNPKVTLFFVAIFAALVDPTTPKGLQAAYGLYLSLATMAWFFVVSTVFTGQTVRRAFLRGGHWIDRAMGAVFIGLAAALAFASMG